MNTDLSVAPEIAQLAAPPPAAAQPGAGQPGALRTDGRACGDLTDLAASPQRWWDLVRFDERGPVLVPLPDAPGAWLLILPPGGAAACRCRLATALAGEAAESGTGGSGTGGAGSARLLRPGRVLVHGAPVPHRVLAAGAGYSVTLHHDAAGVPVPAPARSPQRILRAGPA